MEVATRFKVKPIELSITCVRRLRAHPRHLTRASKLVLCKRGFNISTIARARARTHTHTVSAKSNYQLKKVNICIALILRAHAQQESAAAVNLPLQRKEPFAALTLESCVRIPL
jgi:hypothetical protein